MCLLDTMPASHSTNPGQRENVFADRGCAEARESEAWSVGGYAVSSAEGVTWSADLGAAIGCSLGRCSRREHLLKHRKHTGERGGWKMTKGADEALRVHRAQLIRHDVPALGRESARHAEREGPPSRGERRDGHRSQVGIQLVR
jgi:hypothetical protein